MRYTCRAGTGAGRDRRRGRHRLIGLPILILTATFAIGTTLPLLARLAGRGVADRVGASRRRQRIVQVAGGITMVVSAAALVFNLPHPVARRPNYTAAMQKAVGANKIRQQLGGPGRGALSDCTDGAERLGQCGPAPAVSGVTGWLNTPAAPRSTWHRCAARWC